LVLRDVVSDVVTDQTCAHDPLMYIPNDMTLEQAGDLRQNDLAEYSWRSHQAMGGPLQSDARFQVARQCRL
jgi:urocanate hydratase